MNTKINTKNTTGHCIKLPENQSIESREEYRSIYCKKQCSECSYWDTIPLLTFEECDDCPECYIPKRK